MLIDRLCPEYDATRAEHRVLAGRQEELYDAVLHADFLEAWRGNPAVRALFGLRAAGERLASAVRRRPPTELLQPEALRLVDMPVRGDWVMLGQDPPREVVFGVVGRFWAGQTVWEQIDGADFAAFDRPGLAKIACNFSLLPYGAQRTLISYEARTRATDPDSRRAFLRYWRPLSPFIGVVMRSQLSVVQREAGRRAVGSG